MGGGRVMRTPAERDEVMGHVVRSWLMSAWAQSRAAAWICSGVGGDGRGLASWMRRLPRSKV